VITIEKEDCTRLTCTQITAATEANMQPHKERDIEEESFTKPRA